MIVNKKIAIGARKKMTGFSFLELMIVIGIIGIMTVVSIVSFSSSKKNVVLTAAANEVISHIKLARSYALLGKYPVGVSSIICGYGFKFTDATHYQIFYYIDAGSGCQLGVDGTVVDEQTLQNGVSCSISGFSCKEFKIYFPIPNANAFVHASADPLVYELNYFGIKKEVKFHSKSGLIDE